MNGADLDSCVPAIVAGDPHAFGQWAAGAEVALRRSLWKFRAHVDTEAVLQETLLRVWEIAPGFDLDGPPGGLLRLAFRIARNLAITEVRRTRPAVELESIAGADDEPGTEWRAPDPHLREIIARCRKKLPRRPSSAIEARLTNAGGHPDQLLAERLGMRLNTFLQNITRARRLLAECLARNGVDLDLEMS